MKTKWARDTLLKKLEEKKSYHNRQFTNYSNQMIEKSSPIIRINAAMSRERVRTYDEIINLLT